MECEGFFLAASFHGRKLFSDKTLDALQSISVKCIKTLRTLTMFHTVFSRACVCVFIMPVVTHNQPKKIFVPAYLSVTEPP